MHVQAKRVLRWFSMLALGAGLANCSDAGSTIAQGSAGSAGLPSMAGAEAGSVATAGASGGGLGGANAAGSNAAGGGGGSSGGGAGSGGSGGSAGSAGSASSGGSAASAGSTGSAGGPSSYRPCPTDGSACKIMPFGDSITDGYNPDTPGGYRVELFRLAHAANKSITFVGSAQNGPNEVDGTPFPRQHEGHSGWTIAPAGGRSGISTLVSTVMPQFKPHVVLLMIGTNDAIDNYELAKAPERLGALIDSIYERLPEVLIVVGQPVPSRGDASKGDDTALSARIKTFCDAIPAVAKQRFDAGKHILVVDLNTPFAPNKASLLEDQWHPNAAGYVLLAQHWYDTLGPLL
jgi:lysophospholipase L1-like esterase